MVPSNSIGCLKRKWIGKNLGMGWVWHALNYAAAC